MACRKAAKKTQVRPKDIYQARRQKLLSLLPPGNVTIVASGSPPKDWRQRFMPYSNFLYLTGLPYPDTIAILRAVDSTPEYILFWKEPGEKEAIWSGPRMGLKEVKKFTAATEVYSLSEFSTQLPTYLKGANYLIYSLGIESSLDGKILESRNQLLMQRSTNTIAPLAILELNKFVEKIRIYKEPEEILALRRAAEITAKAYMEALQAASPGMYEYEIEALLHYVFRKYGAQGPGFLTIVASGENATILHYNQNNRRIKKNELLLVDSGAKYDNYAVDVSRTWPVSKKFTEQQKSVYRAVLETQKHIIAQIKPGVQAITLHEEAVKKLTEWMIALKLLKGKPEDLIAAREHEKYYPHRTNHWLGLEVHDIGGYFDEGNPTVLEAGMVLTVEPGLYIRSEPDVPAHLRGIGVRIEDDVLVTQKGCEVLTMAIPKEIEELEDIRR